MRRTQTTSLGRIVIFSAVIILSIGSLAFAQAEQAAPAAPPTSAAPVTPPEVTLPPLPEVNLPPLAPGVPTLVPTNRPLTLNEAIALALQHQPDLSLAGAGVVSAAGRTKQAASGLLPAINVSAQYSKSGPAPEISTPLGGSTTTNTNSYSTSISGQQLLFDFGRTSAEVSQARRQEESARQSLAQTREDVINQVKQAYYTLLQNQQLVEVQRRNVADQQAHLELTRARFHAGVAPRADVVRAETSVATAILSLATAENNAATALVNLNLAMGVDVRTPTQVEETTEPPPALPPLEQIVEQALSNRPAVRQSRADLAAAQEGLRVARTGNLPALVAVGNIGWRDTTFPPSTESWSYGASLQFPLYNGGATSGQIRAAQGNLQAAQARLRQTEQAVGSEVTQAYLSVQTAAQQVTAAEAEVANAEESLRLATGRYQAGVAAFIEVIDGETALLTARTNRVNVVYGLSMARAALQRALGQ